jgi:hypothetical protein
MDMLHRKLKLLIQCKVSRVQQGDIVINTNTSLDMLRNRPLHRVIEQGFESVNGYIALKALTIVPIQSMTSTTR